jgi:hypothetical protein
MRILLRDMISLKKEVKKPKKRNVQVYKDEEKERGKFVWMDFEGVTIKFGHHLDSPAVESKVIPFIDSIASLDEDRIENVFDQVRDILQNEYEAASQIAGDMKGILNENSRWVFYFYVANMRKSPFAIRDNVTLEVEDPAGSRFTKDCYIADLDFEEDEPKISDINHPLIVGPESEMFFAIITSKTQSEMDKGSAIREAFERGEAKFKVKIPIIKKGFFKHQTYESEELDFSS